MTAPQTVDYYFSVVSPWAYLGNARFHDLVERAGAHVVYHPLSSPDLFPATGGKLLKDRAQHRKDYRLVEMERWSTHLGMPLNLHPKHFPAPEAPASKLILAAQEAGHDAAALVAGIFKAVWVEDRNIGGDETLTVIADASGLDGAKLMAAAASPAFDQAFADATQTAIARGVFGYPSYIVNGEVFWGQDRLDFVERALGL